MSDVTRSLARYGFSDPDAASRELPDGWADDVRYVGLLDALGSSADPDSALRRLNRLGLQVFSGALEAPDFGRRLALVLGYSEYLTDLIVRTEGAASELIGGPAAQPTDLRSRKDLGLLRIAAADLSAPVDRASFESTGMALSNLADECLQSLVAPNSGLAVFAMGKYGGCELNYSSDIDVLFVAEDGVDAEDLARAVMSEMNGPPTIWRVDADLRPEGRDGPLVRSLEAYLNYYKRWAQVWEFQSLIKCRFAAGDTAVGAKFMSMINEFVWPDKLAPGAVEQVRALKGRAEREVERRGLQGREIKLGRGGIRDVEFAVQLLQLVHGRHDPALRVRSTLEGLDLLASQGYVATDDATALADAYVFLRHTEHRLQLVAGRQTHTLPTQAERRQHLARGLGLTDVAEGSALERFEDRWRQTTSIVRRIHERLFYRPLLEVFGSATAVGDHMSDQVATARLSALGFDRPPRARESIAALTSGTSRHSKVMRAILPAMLAWLADTPDPDSGLTRLVSLTDRLDSLPHLLAMLRDEPPVAEALARALGTGPVASNLLEREPGLVASLSDREPVPAETLKQEAISIVSRAPDVGAALSALRRYKDGHWLSIATRDLGHGWDRDAFIAGSRELSDVADACLSAALHMAREQVDESTGGPPPGGFAIVGMGRLGGRELSNASDLDVQFVYELEGECPDGTEDRLYHSSVAEKVIEYLGSVPPIFKVDSDLRPEGKNGAITRSLDFYSHYYERWAQTWEFQAMSRARHCAGDAEVSAKLLALASTRVWPAKLGAEQVQEVRHMKARIERERVNLRDKRRNVKLGEGGLADVEFTVQLLAMRHGSGDEQLKSPNTLEALERIREIGRASRTDAAWLRDAYLLLNRVRNHMFLLRGLPTDVLPTGDEDLERLARSLGYGRLSRTRFEEEYRRVTRRARQVCDRLFYGEDGPSEAPA